MNKQEAIQAMRDGNKVTHKNFDSKKWMRSSGRITFYEFEDGNLCSHSQFWGIRQEEVWNTGWRVINSSGVSNE